MQQQWDWAIFNYKGILGRGLGYGTNSARAFGDIALIETFHPKVFYEIGPLGLLAFMVFLTHLTILTFQKYRSVRDKVLCSFASSFWVFILIISYFPYWYPLDTDPVAVYYWFLAGIVFKIPQIDKQEREKPNLIEENKDLKEPKPKNKKYSSSKAA
jgi:predicted membrane protein